MPTLHGQRPAALVDNVHVETWKVVLASPLLRLVEQAGADAQAACLRMDTRLVGEVCDASLSVCRRISDDVALAERDPPVCPERGLVPRPPIAKLVAGEPDRVVLAEVRAVPGSDERCDA